MSKRGRDHSDDRQFTAKKKKDEDDEQMNCSQQPDFNYNPTMGGEAEVGIIERVSLRNFMCHDKLDISFGPNVNYLIGRNGSGKSSVMTGIVVGLGGKATATNRGTSIKTFIKNGRSSSDVVIKLRNRGPDAYRSAEYGESIIVERRITAEGGGGYKLKSATGQVVSMKRDELVHILDQFNIQVDNPVAILNQETSRNFLHSKSPNDKYKFFLKATQLQQMKDDYINANEAKDIAMGCLEDKQEHLPKLSHEVQEWEQKYKAFEAIQDLKVKVAALKNEVAWAIVSEKEKTLLPLKKELKGEEERTPKFVKHVEESETKVQALLKKFQDVQNNLKVMFDEVKTLEPKHNDLKATRDDRKKSKKSVQNEVDHLSRELRSTENDKKALIDRIEQEKRSHRQQDYDLQKKAREERIEQLSSQLEKLKAQQKTTDHSLEQFRAAVRQSKEASYKLRNDEQDIGRTCDNLRQEIRNLESARSDKLRRFGAYMPELMTKIQHACQAGKFHQKPRGPIGAGLNLMDPQWSQAMEVCLGGLLHAFCVNDHHDERELERIMRTTIPANSRKPAIITARFQTQPYDVSQHKCQTSQYPTVLDMIEKKSLDPVICNCLIDQRNIETILLIGQSKEARNVMMNNIPRNTKEAFTLVGDQLYCLPNFRYYSNTKKPSNLLTSNLEGHIKSLKVQQQKQEQDLALVRQQLEQSNSDMRANQMEEKKTHTQINKITNQIARFDFATCIKKPVQYQVEKEGEEYFTSSSCDLDDSLADNLQENGVNLEKELQELRSYEEPCPPDVTTLEEEVERYQDTVDDLQQKLTVCRQRLEDANSEFQTAEKAYNEIDKKMRSIAHNSDPAQEEVAKIEGQIEKAKSDKRHYENKKKEHQDHIAELLIHLEAKEKDVEEDVAKATQICERITTKRTSKNIQSEIIQIQKRITMEEKTRGNQEEIRQTYKEKLKGLTDITKGVQQMKTFLKNLDQVMEQRQQQFSAFRQMIAMRARYFFIMMLNNRQYNGKMKFDHKSEVLNLDVQPTKVEKDESKHDVRSLSGGERSFSTVCFILALWDAMESPFRMLDEFDVFMDMVNRDTSMKMMMQTAQFQRGRQFIFLTPLSMSYVKQNSNIRIFELRAPERGQSTLTFTDHARGGEEEDEEETSK